MVLVLDGRSKHAAQGKQEKFRFVIAADANKCLQQIKLHVIPHTYSSLSESCCS